MFKKSQSGTGTTETPAKGEGQPDPKEQAQGTAGQSTEGKTNAGEGQGQEDPDEAAWDEKTKAYIEKLRRESATHRTKAKDVTSKLTATEEQFSKVKKALGLDQESQETPEQKVQKLESQSGQLEFRNAILEQALVHGIGPDGIKYFTFLVNEAAEALQEGEELTDDMLAEIAKDVKTKSTKTPANTSVAAGANGKAGAPAPGGKSDLTVDQFVKMSLGEKSALYIKDKAKYDTLMSEARRSNKLLS